MDSHFFKFGFSFFRKNKKLLFITFSSLLLLWLLALFLFPLFFSKGFLCQQINKQIHGQVTIKKASMSWFKPQRFEGIHIRDNQGKTLLEVESLTTQASLLNLLSNSKNLKETKVRGMKAFIYASEEKPSQMISSLGSNRFFLKEPSLNKKSSVYIFKVPLFGQFQIDDSKLTIFSSQHDPIEFKDIQFYCQLPEKASSFKAHLACESTQGNLSGSVNLNLELGGFDEKRHLIFTPYERDLFFLSPEGFLDLNAQVNHLPSNSLDHILTLFNPKLSSLFSNATGGPLDLGAHLHLVKNKSKIDLNAQAKDLELRFCGAVQQNQFFLTEPSICRLRVRPYLIQNLSSSLFANAALTSQDSAEALIQIDRLTMPLDAHNFNFSNLSCNAQLSLSPMKFLGDSRIQNFEISQIKGSIDTFDLNENVMVHLSMTALDNQKPIHFKLDGQLSKLIDSQSELKGIEQIKAQFVAQAKDFPTSFALFFFKEKELAKEVLGPSFNLDTHFRGSLSSALLNMNLETSRVKISDLEFRLRDKNLLTLTEPTTVSLRITPSLAKKASDYFSILHPIHLNGDLKNCELKISPPKLAFNNLQLDLSASAFDFFISSYKPCHIDCSEMLFKKEDGKDLTCDLDFRAELPKDMPFYHLDRSFKGKIKVEHFLSFLEGKSSLIETRLTAKNWLSSFQGHLDRNLNLEWAQEFTLDVQNPAFSPSDDFSLKAESLKVHFSPSSINLMNFNPQNQDLSGLLSLTDLYFEKGSFSQTFNSVKVPFEYTAKADQLTLSIKDEQTLSELQLHCKQLFKDRSIQLKNGHYHLTAKTKGISPNFLNAFSNNKYDFESILGPHLDLRLNSHFSMSKQLEGNLEYNLCSSILKSEGHLSFGDKLQLAKPGLVIDYFMSPASYLALNQFISKGLSSTLLLEQPLSLKIEIESLSKLLNSNTNESPLAFDGKLIADQFVTNKGSLYELSGTFNTSHIFNNLKLNLSGKTTNIQSKEGVVHLSAELTEPFKPGVRGIDSKINGYIDCRLTHFPTALLAEFTSFKKSELKTLLQLMGPSFDLHWSSNLVSGNGPLKGSLKSDHVAAKFCLSLEKDHLNLKEDLLARLKLDPSSSSALLSQINPLFSSLKNATPILNLKISKEGFYLPTSPFNLAKTEIASATLSMEKFQLEKNSFYSKLLKFLKSDFNEQKVELWPTPTHFSLKDNALEISRTDFLINRKVHLAFWGKYKLNQNKGQFFLSLPASTLKNTFNISKLPSNYMFQIPIQKKGNTLSVDWATAAAQIGILGITSHFEGPAHYIQENPGSTIDEVLDLFAKTQPSGQSPLCPYPLPWTQKDLEGQKTSRSKEASQQEQTAILQNFFKDLKKALSLSP